MHSLPAQRRQKAAKQYSKGSTAGDKSVSTEAVSVLSHFHPVCTASTIMAGDCIIQEQFQPNFIGCLEMAASVPNRKS